VIAAHQAGLQNVVGVLGTALGDDHVKALRSLAERVVLIFDGDTAGQNAVERSLELFLKHEVDVRVLTLPDKLDPAEFLAKEGADELRRLVDRANDPLDFIINNSASRYDLHSPEGARLAAQSVLSILAKVPKTDQHGLDLKVAKALDTLSRRLGVSVSDLKRELRRASKPRIKRTPSEPLPTSEVSEKSDTVPIDPASLDPLDLEVVRIALNEPDSVAILQREVPSDALRDACLRGILQSCYDVLADGEYPDFARVSFRLSDQERALAAGLLLPMDPAPMREGTRPAAWLERVGGAVFRLEQRQWEDHLRELRAELQETDPVSEPERYQALRAEFLKHLSRRPGPKPK
jgi:DNA primase